MKSSDTESLYCIHCYLQLHRCQNRPEPENDNVEGDEPEEVNKPSEGGEELDNVSITYHEDDYWFSDNVESEPEANKPSEVDEELDK